MKIRKKALKQLSSGDWHDTLLSPTASIQDAIRVLNQVSLRIVLVVDNRERLIGTVSDGDIRRGLLRGLGLESPLLKILRRNPLVVHQDQRSEVVAQLMLANEIQQIPILDTKRKVVGLHLWSKLTEKPRRSNLVVIMAGGEGRRLHPFTADRPKPLVEVGGKPILEHILVKAKEEGFSRFVVAVHHLGKMIENFIGNGKRWGVEVSYLREKAPLGTAGAIRLITPNPKLPILVTNGDVLADFQYGDLLDFHVKHGAEATMAVRTHEWRNPYGVVETQGLEIISFQEKPLMRAQINAGVYVLNPKVLQIIPKKEKCDMPELFSSLQASNFATIAYPLHEPWIDIGRPEDLKKMEDKLERNKNLK